jgi:hypothetical protein
MPEITPDLKDESRCISVHWSLPVQCVLPNTHRENWHEAGHPHTGNRMRYRRSMGVFVTEELHDGAWHDLTIPAPGAVCGEPHPSRSSVNCQMGHGENGNRWNHFATVDGCRHSWNTPPPGKATPEQLASDVATLRARVAELEAITANAEKLVHGWLRTSAEHISVSHLDAVRDTPLIAGMQEGRANQYSDCANELRDVLDGEDPDGTEFGVGIVPAGAGDAPC